MYKTSADDYLHSVQKNPHQEDASEQKVPQMPEVLQQKSKQVLISFYKP
jgi:hypothetical protein